MGCSIILSATSVTILKNWGVELANKHDILENYYKEVWERGDLDAVDTYFNLVADTNRIIDDAGIVPSEIREWVSIIRSFVTNISVRVVKSVEEGDWISAYLEINCQRIDNGAAVHVYQQIKMRFVGDQKIESYPQFDFLRFFEQIGQLPENTFELLMGGARLK